jgi:aspartyl protease family protein
MKYILRVLCVFWLVMPITAIASALPLEVVGLFKNHAVVRLQGSEFLMKAGDTRGGVTLVSADARQARVAYQGREHVVGLSNRVSSQYRAVDKAQVVISSDSLGQYWIRGAINNHFTNFLVDTGASVVAISEVDARQLGIEFDASHQGTVQTAQGTADTHFVTLDEIVVGGITAYNVRAAIIAGEYPLEPLLGMSFLRQVSLQENAGVLTLTKQH